MTTLELEARLDNLLTTAQTETKDIDLFAPIAEREECPVCLQTLSIKEDEILFMSCCGKKICCGCIIKSKFVDKKNGVPDHKQKCAFCRQPHSLQNKTSIMKALKKLIKKNNPDAFAQMAGCYKEGDGVRQSDTKSLEMLIRAAELGHANSYAMIGNYYRQGCVVDQNTSIALEYYEVGAKKGSIYAHRKLAIFDWDIGNSFHNDLAVTHKRCGNIDLYQTHEISCKCWSSRSNEQFDECIQR